MIQSLYEPFKKWSEKGSVWLISDPHFDDKDCKLMNPNWISPEEHIKRINEKVHKNDTLVCLGDCGDLKWFDKINAGYKVLIKGNHDDKGNSVYKKSVSYLKYDANLWKIEDAIKDVLSKNYKVISKETALRVSLKTEPLAYFSIVYETGYFDEVYSGALFIAPKIILSHEPVDGLKFATNIHGHVHNGQHEYSDCDNCKHVNIASDVVNWEPLSLATMIKAGLVSDVPTIHRITIDKASNNESYGLQKDKKYNF